MAFVVSAGALRAVDRPVLPAVYALRLSQDVVSDYGTLWRTQPELRTVVDFLARNIAQLGLHVFRRVSDVDRQRQPTHPLARLLERPNSYTTRYRLIDHLVHDICVYDEAYWLKVRADDGLASLRRLRPQRVWPTGDDWTEPDGFRIVGSKGSLDVDASNIVWFRGYNPHDDRAGTPPIESLRRILAEEWAANVYREQLWRNSARVGGYLKRPVEAPDWSDKARDRFRDGWQAQWAGDSATAGGTPILEDGMDFVPAATSPRDAQYVECVAGDTSLVMADGTRRRADEVNVGEDVVSWSDGGFVAAQIAAVTRTVPVPTVAVTDQTGRTLRTSRNHLYLVVRGPHRTPGGRSLGSVDDRAEWVAAADLSPGDLVRVALGADVVPGTDELDHETAWALGALVGNGHLCSRASIGYSGASRTVAARLADWCLTRGARLMEHPTRPGCFWVNGSRHVRAVLEPMGLLGRRAPDKFVPDAVTRSGPKAWAAFLAGYLDTDGTITHTAAPQPMVTWSSASRQLLDGCQHLLALLGFSAVLRQVTPTHVKQIQGQDCLVNAVYALTVNGRGQMRALAEVLHPAHEVKAQRLATWALAPQRTNGARSDPRWSRVARVEPAGEAPTYAVTIAGTHTHITAGLVTHNSRKLTREEVARSFHVPLPMVGILDKATFSNIREQHKNLYADCLGPWLEMIQQEIEVQLLPDLPDNTNLYVEFNINEKLRGSFEEQAAQLSSGVGAPYMTRNEARARLNLPQIDGADDLVVPLNVAMSGGGPAAPADVSGEAGRGARRKRHVKARAPLADTTHANTELSQFFRRQGSSVASALGAAKARRVKADVPDVFDIDRWNEQLARLLKSLNARLASAAAVATLAALGGDPTEFDPTIMDGWLEAEAGGVAAGINAATAAQLVDALTGDDPLGAVKHLFEVYASARAAQIAVTQTTAMSGFGSVEAGKHAAGDTATKTWIAGSNPRPSHARLSGQTVGLHEQFSNGARWPGDSTLGSEDICGCNCQLVINA